MGVLRVIHHYVNVVSITTGQAVGWSCVLKVMDSHVGVLTAVSMTLGSRWRLVVNFRLRSL